MSQKNTDISGTVVSTGKPSRLVHEAEYGKPGGSDWTKHATPAQVPHINTPVAEGPLPYTITKK